jgi:hypothetical protein
VASPAQQGERVEGKGVQLQLLRLQYFVVYMLFVSTGEIRLGLKQPTSMGETAA